MQTLVGVLAEQWYERMAAIPELEPWNRPELRDSSLINARRDIGREVDGLASGRLLPATCPDEVADSAQLAAATDFPLWACVQSYRAGHAVQWNAWSDAVEARSLAHEDRTALLQAGSDYMFAYADRCARWVEAEYTRARDHRLRSQEQQHVQLVRNLLDGKPADPTKLDYRLDAWHIGAVVSGIDTDPAVRELAERLDAQLLLVAVDALHSWVWFGTTSPTATPIDRHLRSMTLPSSSSFAIGEAGHGLEGFRQTHQEARDTVVIAAQRHQAITRHDEVSLELLAVADPPRAKNFVARELGPLAANDRRAQTLRETLRIYFSAAQTASSAAAILGVHERTIGNRLRAIEHLLGRSVTGRRAELETALRIQPLLDEHHLD